jgi:hypothetical protein
VNAVQAAILDEYAAYNLYQAVIEQFGPIRPFTNIQAAEAQHIEAWKQIFSQYAIPLPPVPVLEQKPQFAIRFAACEAAANAEIANAKLYENRQRLSRYGPRCYGPARCLADQTLARLPTLCRLSWLKLHELSPVEGRLPRRVASLCCP